MGWIERNDMLLVVYNELGCCRGLWVPFAHQFNTHVKLSWNIGLETLIQELRVVFMRLLKLVELVIAVLFSKERDVLLSAKFNYILHISCLFLFLGRGR